MRNYTVLFSFLLLFVISDLDAQRSRRSSGRIDKTEIKQSNEKESKELHKAYGFESKEEMKDFLLDKDLKRKDRRIVEKYGKGKKLSKGQNRRLEQLLEEYNEDRGSVQTSSRSGRLDGESRSSGRDRRGKAVRGKSGRLDGESRSSGRDRRGKAVRGKSGRLDGESRSSGRDRRGKANRNLSRSGRQEAHDEHGPPPFEEVDANGDGEISREEARAFFGDEPDFDAQYDNVDTDNNGSVDPQEFADANEEDRDGEHDWYCQICDMHFDSGEAMDDHAEQMGHTNADLDCDPNHDYPQMDPGPDGGCADYADCNGNGLFDVGEPCYEGHDQGGPPFEEVDANGDGSISREEARAFFGDEPDFDAQFDEADLNNDGSVNMDEWHAADNNDGDDG